MDAVLPFARVRLRTRAIPRVRRAAVAGFVAVLLAAGLQQVVTWPGVGSLATTPPESSAAIERARAALGGDGFEDVSYIWVPYERIAPALKLAILAGEDTRFFDHGGFDHVEIRAAIRDALRDREAPRGASTITQQLARLLWLSSSRTPWRKAKEAVLTLQLEQALSKRRILELYLNLVPFAPDTFGAEAAAQRVWGIHASELSESQAVQLAAVLPAPAVWNVDGSSLGYLRHVAVIRAHMASMSVAAARL